MKKIIFLVLSVLVVSFANISAGEVEGNKLLKKMVAKGKKGPQSWVCSNCNKHYTTDDGLRYHLKTVDLEEYFAKPKCLICGKKFSASGLLRHMKTEHGNGEVFHCSNCDYVNRVRCEVAKHDRRVHKKIKNFKCNSCEQLFFEKHPHACRKALWERITPLRKTKKMQSHPSRKRKRKKEAQEDSDSDTVESAKKQPSPKRKKSSRRAALAVLKRLKKFDSEDDEIEDDPQDQPQLELSEDSTVSSLLDLSHPVTLPGLPDVQDAPEELDLSDLR